MAQLVPKPYGDNRLTDATSSRKMDQSTVAFYAMNAATVAARYETVVSSLSDHFAKAFRPNSKLLDIGFGSGRDLAALVQSGHNCYGIDPTAELIDAALNLHPELTGKLGMGHGAGHA